MLVTTGEQEAEPHQGGRTRGDELAEALLVHGVHGHLQKMDVTLSDAVTGPRYATYRKELGSSSSASSPRLSCSPLRLITSSIAATISSLV